MQANMKNPKATLAFIAIIAVLLIVSRVFLVGGDGRGPLGDMSNVSYRGARGQVTYQTLNGERIGMEYFAGKFLWVDYSAGWCGYCKTQAEMISTLAEDYDEQTVVFLTILTGDVQGRATPETASAWADTYGLQEEHVVTASPGAGGRILPSHRLYSPEGHLLFIADGLQPEATIRSIVDGRISAWKAWKASGVMAEWMH